ncbi:hypothetical protein RV14_GL001914 [Enterococcus ratti]|uniref:Uncharacterized protein n=1 Tax=Enterococcus ratti TaxID=150033 RepID=A0A1L8WQA8_9ENTE|nr:hypothetical protein RV14_GL001914 [Enterococcus ratti]
MNIQSALAKIHLEGKVIPIIGGMLIKCIGFKSWDKLIS